MNNNNTNNNNMNKMQDNNNQTAAINSNHSNQTISVRTPISSYIYIILALKTNTNKYILPTQSHYSNDMMEMEEQNPFLQICQIWNDDESRQ